MWVWCTNICRNFSGIGTSIGCHFFFSVSAVTYIILGFPFIISRNRCETFEKINDIPSSPHDEEIFVLKWNYISTLVLCFLWCCDLLCSVPFLSCKPTGVPCYTTTLHLPLYTCSCVLYILILTGSVLGDYIVYILILTGCGLGDYIIMGCH